MRLIKNTTELIGIKDQNINISLVFETDTHIEIQAKLDYPAPSCPHCHGKMIKYDFQKPSKIPLLEQAGTPTLLRLKKRRFQCKNCRRVTVAETSIVEKNCQISNLVRQKLTQLLTEKMSLTDIARKLRVSTSTVYRKLDQFTFKEHYDKLPTVMSWDEFGFKKGEFAFVAQNYGAGRMDRAKKALYNGIGQTKFVMLQGIAGAFGVRVPVSYLMSLRPDTSLFKIGLATPMSSVVQLLLCLGFMVILNRRARKGEIR